MKYLLTAISIFLFANASFAIADAIKITIPAMTATVGTDEKEIKLQMISPIAKSEWYRNESPERKVDIKSFRIDSTEVTNISFFKIFPKHTYPSNLAEHPVVNVSWMAASEYCGKVGGRLPTEDEWEAAARGSQGSVYPWSNDFISNNAVYSGTEFDNSLKIGSFELEESISSKLGGTRTVASIEAGKSEFGAYDMAGNVWEWVDGWYDNSKRLRILKGGSWLSPAESLRSATKLGDEPESKFNDYGFRCAYNID